MKKNKRVISPIASFNYHLENYNGLIKSFRKNNDVSHIGSMLKDCFTSELTTQINQEDYDALVLTDTSQNILWVNDGFKNMTGYTKKFAIGKRPSFLQGEKTSTSIKKELRDKLGPVVKFNWFSSPSERISERLNPVKVTLLLFSMEIV